jgi:hypothetical protein
MSSRIALIALLCVGASDLAVAQTEPTSPTPKEAPTTPSNASTPASASSPHQRQAMSKEPTSQQMKDCIAKQKSENSNMSKDEAKKACKAEFKAHQPTSH